jgi:carboxypeptidase T
MFKYIFTLLLLPSFLLAQNANYSRLKIFFNEKNNIDSLAKIGIEADHGYQQKNKYIISDFSKKEIEKIKNQGFQYDILADDAEAYYENLATQNTSPIFWQCGTPYDFKHVTPKKFKLGSMAGYYTYPELLGILNDMHNQYPLLVSKPSPIDTFLTFEKRPIFHLTISDNPTQKESTENQVLYTALHHAREPASLSQMIYFMWYLLENYDKSPKIKYLLDNTSLHFIPCVNPDGYVYNQTQQPNGGGLWRKNRRLNADGSVGVDLNRNYGQFWGKDDIGSSPDGDSEVYRGKSAFSEPETQAIRWFCEQNKFVTAANYHSFGNLLLYSDDNFAAATDTAFTYFADELTRSNAYLHGSVQELLGYATNGDANDWMFAEKKITSFIPEVSEAGFWSPTHLIKDICADNLHANLLLASHADDALLLRNQSATYTNGLSSRVDLLFRQIGVKKNNHTITIKPLTNNVLSYKKTPSVLNLNLWEQKKISFDFQLQPTVKEGEPVIFLVTDNNGIFDATDTVTMYYQNVSLLVNEKGNHLKNFDNDNNWGVTINTFVSPPASLTDSPQGNYAPGAFVSTITTKNTIKIPANGSTYLRFWAKWQIERNSDFAAVGVTTLIGTLADPLCGRHTQNTNADIVYRQPVFHGEQLEWVQEEMDLTAFAGQNVYLQFYLYSDANKEFDGIYLDDIQIWSPSNNVSVDVDNSDFEVKVYPTIAASQVVIDAAHLQHKKINYRVTSATGQVFLEEKNIFIDAESINIGINFLPKGIYFINIMEEEKNILVKKFIKQ